MSSEFNFKTSSQEVKAEAFNIIAKYVHDTYDGVVISNVTSDEAFFCTVVRTTEQLLEAYRATEEF